MECRTAETMMDGLHNCILHQTTEILAYLGGITNSNNAVGKVQECIDNTQLAQDNYLERLKAAVNKLATVQLEAEALLVPLPPSLRREWRRVHLQQQQLQRVVPHQQ